MKKMRSKVLLVTAGALCLANVGGFVQATQNSGGMPPAKITQGSHAPMALLEFCDVSWPEAASPGKDIPIRFSIVNNGAAPTKNILIRAESQDLDALVPKSTSTVNAQYFAPKQKETYTFNFRLTSNAKTKNYPIKLTATYVDATNGEIRESTQIVTVISRGGNGSEVSDAGSSSHSSLGGGSGMGGFSGGDMGDLGPSLPVTGSGGAPSGQPATGANTPKIVIDSYTMDPETAKAGEPFTLYFKIFNTNRKKQVRNIRVALSADAAEPVSLPSGSSSGDGAAAAAAAAAPSGGGDGGSAFIPVGSSNTFHIESIKPRHSAEKEITLTTAPDTAAKTYSITATFEYEDGNGNPYTSTEVIGIPVVQSSVLEPGDLKVDKEGFVGEEMPLSFEFFNTGKSVLANVMVKLRGNFDADTNTYFAGSVAPSSAETYDVNITPREKGEQKGEIVISYDDSTGKRQEFIKPFVVNVSDGVGNGDEEDENENKRPAWAIPLGLFSLLAIGGGVGFYVYKKRKQKESGDEDLMV